MIVHFGPHLDGLAPARPQTAVGVLTAGPARLLDMLELQLGLPSVHARPGEAVIAYQSCLEDLDSPARFYHASLRVDPIGVARTLLEWRAAWYEAGWRGSFDGAVPRRLADLAEIESLARDRVPATAGQRLRRIADALADGLVTQIERIVLHEDPLALPAAWREVLAHFACEIAPGVLPAAHASPGTDLRLIQETLLELDRDERTSGGASPIDRDERASGTASPLERVQLAGDESLVVLSGVSRDVSA